MCLELCRSEFSKALYGCDWGMTMVSSVRDLCIPGNFEIPHISDMQRRELEDKQLICIQNCKQGCLKLQYKYITQKNKYAWRDTDDSQRGFNKNCILAHEIASDEPLAKMAEKLTC
ncbi:hypothetical protein AVEN_218840-1 [Araneus ventricosus]|uniref:Uncharacterized protein n=1 Tax=Araneus ventricosus TaxID=182803 RepID=A0A4Y2HRG2_ARAVE|nr:hypothetical protein AVEN_218840-1 [Araneus ventricosus]